MEKEKNKSSSYAMQISLQINKAEWGMLVDGKLFAEAEINDMCSQAMCLGAKGTEQLKIKKSSAHPSMVREFSLFSHAKGDTLFTQSWTPISAKVRGLFVLLHGLNEHSVRWCNCP